MRRGGCRAFARFPRRRGDRPHPQQRGRFLLSERTVQICAISLWRPSGGQPRRELVGFASMAALCQFPRVNGSSQARLEEPLYGCFLWVVQGRRAPRRPSSRRPSRFFPPPRSTDGARIKQSGTNLAPAAASKPSTNARPTEMPMKQREPGEPGRPNGCQDCPSPKHRLLWTVPKDIVRLCEPQPGQLHLGQAGPEDQVLSEWLKSATLPGAQARTGPGL